MTNEEKVLQILSNNGYHKGNAIDFDNAKDMLKQMAQWKDEQYQREKIEELEKIIFSKNKKL